VGGTSLKKAVGEATGRRADIQAAHCAYIKIEVFEGALQLKASPTDEWVVGDFKANLCALWNLAARLIDDLVVDKYLTRQDQSLRTVPGCHQASFHQEQIDACASSHLEAGAA